MNKIIDKKLKLVSLKESHAKDLYNLTDTNRDYLNKWLPWVKLTNSVSDTKKFIRSSMRKSKAKKGFDCLIYYDNKIAGTIGLVEICTVRSNAEIGYWLAENFTGKGIMTKCCEVLTDHCFQKLKLNRVVIKCEVKNKASRSIPERLKFFNQGILKCDGFYNDKYVDHVQYSMFKREWGK
ncbi:MAG TPA: GNAT family protein [Ignavibacteria bacterium]|nr:GNAT family protein [Ignavibacteria bacterium]